MSSMLTELMMSRVRVYLASSLNGYIAGPGDDLSFLEGLSDKPQDDGALDFARFMKEIGALLMGRRTHDLVKGFGHWPYGDTPVLVATHRPLEPAFHTVRPLSGDIHTLVNAARDAAGGRDIYVDGGDLVRQALAAGLVDELCITVVPTLLPEGGTRLFGGLLDPTRLEFTGHHRLGAMVQLIARVQRTHEHA